MTDDEINEAIAEACGWTDLRAPHQDLYGNHPNPEIGRTRAPNFCEDLNAMHEAVVSQEEHVQMAFMLELCERCKEWRCFPILTDAPQRAEAFLRTLGKWKEGV